MHLLFNFFSSYIVPQVFVNPYNWQNRLANTARNKHLDAILSGQMDNDFANKKYDANAVHRDVNVFDTTKHTWSIWAF